MSLTQTSLGPHCTHGCSKSSTHGCPSASTKPASCPALFLVRVQPRQKPGSQKHSSTVRAPARGVGAGHVAQAAGAPCARQALQTGGRVVGAVVAGDAGALRLLRVSGRTEREEATLDGHLAAGTEAAGLAEAAIIAVDTHEARVAGTVFRRIAARAA